MNFSRCSIACILRPDARADRHVGERMAQHRLVVAIFGVPALDDAAPSAMTIPNSRNTRTRLIVAVRCAEQCGCV